MNVSPSDVAIQRWADSLIPEAFAIPTRAHRVEIAPARQRPAEFAEWVEQQRTFARTVEYDFGGETPPDGDHPLGLAIVEHGDERWRWDADCDLPRCLANRVRADVGPFPAAPIEGRVR